MLPAGHQQATSSVRYTTSRKHRLVLLRMGEIIARNVFSWLKLLIKLLLLHLVGCLYYCISDAWSHKYQNIFIFTFFYTAEWTSVLGFSTFRNDPFSYYSFYISWPFLTYQFEFAQLAYRFSHLPAIARVTSGQVCLLHCMSLTVLLFDVSRLFFNNLTYFTLSKKKSIQLKIIFCACHYFLSI